MGTQRNNPQMKGKEEAPERMLTEKEASQLSDTEFKAMVIRKLTELSELKENYKILYEKKWMYNTLITIFLLRTCWGDPLHISGWIKYIIKIKIKDLHGYWLGDYKMHPLYAYKWNDGCGRRFYVLQLPDNLIVPHTQTHLFWLGASPLLWVELCPPKSLLKL